jgi:hypothetical protein
MAMPNVAEIETIYHIAINDSGGPAQWAALGQSERSKRMYAVMRRLVLAGILVPPVSDLELGTSRPGLEC